MKDIRLYYSDMCERSRRVLDYMKENKIEGVELKDATRDIDMQLELNKLGGKTEVPMYYMNGDITFGEEEIKKELDRL